MQFQCVDEKIMKNHHFSTFFKTSNTAETEEIYVRVSMESRFGQTTVLHCIKYEKIVRLLFDRT